MDESQVACHEGLPNSDRNRMRKRTLDAFPILPNLGAADRVVRTVPAPLQKARIRANRKAPGVGEMGASTPAKGYFKPHRDNQTPLLAS